MIVPDNLIAPIPNIYYPITDIVVPNICHWYFVSTWGLIYNGKTRTFLPQNLMYDKNKYITIRVLLTDGSHKCIQPHRIVLQTFSYIENPENYEVNHKDGVKYHNWLWNLEWMTHSENMEHAKENKLFTYGENRKLSKLSNSQIIELCELIDKGFKNKEIIEIVNFGKDLNMDKYLNNIRFGHCWKEISRNYNFGSSY